jgi:hypothetical protein
MRCKSSESNIRTAKILRRRACIVQAPDDVLRGKFCGCFDDNTRSISMHIVPRADGAFSLNSIAFGVQAPNTSPKMLASFEGAMEWILTNGGMMKSLDSMPLDKVVILVVDEQHHHTLTTTSADAVICDGFCTPRAACDNCREFA